MELTPIDPAVLREACRLLNEEGIGAYDPDALVLSESFEWSPIVTQVGTASGSAITQVRRGDKTLVLEVVGHEPTTRS